MSISALSGAAAATATAPTSDLHSTQLAASPFAAIFASLDAAANPPSEAPAEGTAGGNRLARQERIAESVGRDDTIAFNLGTLAEQAEQGLKQFHQVLTGKLADQGIKLEEPLRLLVRPGDGRIVVQGDHPRKDEIEKILNDDQPLANALRGITGIYDLLRAAERHLEFSRAYEEDPLAAVRTYSYLFDDQTDWPIEFRIDEHGAEVTES